MRDPMKLALLAGLPINLGAALHDDIVHPRNDALADGLAEAAQARAEALRQQEAAASQRHFGPRRTQYGRIPKRVQGSKERARRQKQMAQQAVKLAEELKRDPVKFAQFFAGEFQIELHDWQKKLIRELVASEACSLTMQET